MGKITVTGTARKTFAYNRMKIQIEFDAERDSTREALDTVLSQCEQFLSLMEEAGYPLSRIELDSDDVDRDRYSEKDSFTANRILVFRTAADPEILTWVLDQIREHDFSANVRTTYEHSSTDEMDRQLIKMAIENARMKAEQSVRALSSTITGVESVQIEENRGIWTPDDWMDREQERGTGVLCERSTPFSRNEELGVRMDERSQDVRVVFQTE